MQRDAARDGAGAPRGEQHPGRHQGAVPRSAWRRGGGFVYAGFCGRAACEAEIKEQTKATIRVLPDEEFRSPQTPDDLHVVRTGPA